MVTNLQWIYFDKGDYTECWQLRLNDCILATVYGYNKFSLGYDWFTWDVEGGNCANGTSGTMKQAKLEALEAVLRCGQHSVQLHNAITLPTPTIPK